MSIAVTVGDEGITSPTFAEIYTYLQEQFKTIYGTDSYLNPDSQDGQLLAIFALALHDANQTAVAIYQSFSPSTAFGAALSTNVKINGIARKVATKGQVTLELVGVAGTQIADGIVADLNGKKWGLPALVTLDGNGTAITTATSLEEGDITADEDTVNKIVTTTKGWQRVTNPSRAIPGAPVESDGALRRRQVISTGNPSQAILRGLAGALAAVDGVLRSRVYENDTNQVNEHGHPEHSMTAVVLGGLPEDIAQVIYDRKTPGAYTNGDLAVILEAQDGLPATIRYYAASQIVVRVWVQVHPLNGFVSTTMELIQQAISTYINALGIGRRVDQGRLFLPAQLFGTHPTSRTFEIDRVWLTTDPVGAHLNADVVIPFNGMPVCDVGDVLLTTV